MDSEEKWDSFRNAVCKTIRKLDKRGESEAEAFFTSFESIEVVIRNSQILTENKVDDSGVGFRVILPGKKVGFASTNNLNEEAILKAADEAQAVARVSSEVANFDLPRAESMQEVKGLFDSRVAETSMEEAVNVADRAITAAEDYDERVIAKDGRVAISFGKRGIINTSGVDFEEAETRFVIYLGGSGEEDGQVTPSCYDATFSRTADLNPETVGKNVAEMVVKMFRPKSLESFKGTVIFGPEAVSYQPVTVLIDALKGENVVGGRSAWTAKIGEAVASEALTINDNAVLERGFVSRTFDDEGCPSHDTLLMNKGKLESFIHDASSANALKTANTGNASRFVGGFGMVSMIVGNGYRAKPQIYPSNLIIQPGEKREEELVAETAKGVLVESMAGFAQPGSGVISAQLSRAFFIRDGEIQHPIKGGMVSGVAFDWFKHISGVGKDTKRVMNAVVPSLRVEDVKIIGS